MLDYYKIEYDKKTVKKAEDLVKLLPRILTKMDKENFELGKKNVKDHILHIDKCFMEHAPRVTTAMSNRYYYRGMDRTYEGQMDQLYEEFVVKNFQSVSESTSVAEGFGIQGVDTKEDGTRCCFYRIKLQKGMPYINMINTTQFQHESEILLPRNIKFKLKKITEKEEVIPGYKYPPPNEHMSIPEKRFKYNIYDMFVSMINKDQFKMDTGCNNYGIVTLSLKDYKMHHSTTSKSSINKKLDPIVHKIKLPRCPNGQRRNKKSGKCTKNLTKKNVTKTKRKPVKYLKTKKRCGLYRQKSPSPGCAGVDGCKWIPKIGCLKNDPKIIQKEIDKKKNKDKNKKK
jgi:hypothetical protein